LDSEEILMLKQLSALPSIEIPFEFLETIFKVDKKKKIKFNWNFFKFFQKKKKYGYNHSNLEELLNYLSEKGWLSKLEGEYKLHQIIKEYILANHTPTFEEIEVYLDSFNTLIDNSGDPQVAVDNRENIIYFENLANLLERLEIENKEVGDFFSHFGNIYHHLGLYQKAEIFHLKALKIREKILGEEHPNTATSYNNLAGLYKAQGEYQKAEPLYLKALKISEKILGEEHPSTATSYNNLAGLYKAQGEYQKAEPLYLKVVKIFEKILGEEHPDTATIYNNFAGLYQAQGEYQKAESLYLKALKINEKVLGEEHPDTATSYNNLAVYYYGQGDYKRAYEFIKRAVEVRSKVLPSNHPHLIKTKERLRMIEEKFK